MTQPLAFAEVPQLGQPAIEYVEAHPHLTVVQSGVAHANTDPRFGAEAAVQEARLGILSALACERLVVMVPKGGEKYVDLQQEPPGSGTEAILRVTGDGLITSEPGTGLMLGAADCAPLALYDPIQRVLGLVHIGRPGAELRLGNKVLRAMSKDYDVDPKRVVAHFGPSIAPRSYAAVMHQRGAGILHSEWDPFVEKVSAGYAVDFVGYAAQCLVESAVPATNISRSPVDVGTDPGYFSLTRHTLTQSSSEPMPIGRNGFAVAINRS